jgi:hypothetical protein
VVTVAAGGSHTLALIGNSEPLIQTPLTDREINAGGTAYFRVAAAGSWPLSYQWQFNGADITAETNAVLVVREAGAGQAGVYTVIVRGPDGTVAHSRGRLTIVPALINRQPQNQATYVGGAVQFALEARANASSTYQWQLNGIDVPGATNPALNLAGLKLDQAGTYSLVISNAWGEATSLGARLDVNVVAQWGCSDQSSVPLGLTNVLGVTAGRGYECRGWRPCSWVPNPRSLVLLGDGTVRAWGANCCGQTDVPAGLTNVIAVAAGYNHSLALGADGTVVGWGDNGAGQCDVPSSLSDVVAVAAGPCYSLALQADGSVVGWGNNDYRQMEVPAGLANVVALAAGADLNLALIGEGPPVLTAPMVDPACTDSSFSMSVPTQSDRVYALEYKDTLTDGPWRALPLVAGNGSTRRLTDPTATGAQRFYRVRRW